MIPEIYTYTGKTINLRELREDQICLEDIAHALSQTIRWGGHTSDWKHRTPVAPSVASHSVRVAEMVRERKGDVNTRKAAVLHDASEAYLGDMPAPFKQLFPDFVKMEEYLQEVIFGVFDVDIDAVDWELVNYCDRLDGYREARDLLLSIDFTLWEGFEEYAADLDELPTMIATNGQAAKSRFLGECGLVGIYT